MSVLSAMKSAAALQVRRVEDWWYDWTRGVRTGSAAIPHRAADTAGPARDGYIYLPVRARNLRAALRALPINAHSEYTFIDLGSGKGKSTFVAAELPFRKVIGVEYSEALFRQAEENVRTLNPARKKCGGLEMILADAATYDFPAGKLVVYFFNPFGPEVMDYVLQNLRRAMAAEPRHVVVLMLWPEQSAMVAAMAEMRLCAKNRRYEIFEARA